MTRKDYLRDLILLRNDPGKIPPIREAASAGDPDAQYALGLIYAEGRGIPEDPAQALYWLMQAMDQGDREAELLCRVVASRMTEAEFDAVERLRHRPALSLVKAELSET